MIKSGFIHKILSLGTSQTSDPYKTTKAYITNRIALLTVVLILPYAPLSFYFDLTLGLVTVASLLVFAVIFYSQYKGHLTLSRVLLALNVCSLTWLYHMLITPYGENGITVLHFANFVMVLIPWLLADQRELKLLVLICSLPLIQIIEFQSINNLLNFHVSAHPFQIAWVRVGTSVVSVIYFFLFLNILHRENFKMELGLKRARGIAQKSLKELKAAQLLALNEQKQISLGILASGLSHELNNPLNYIQSGIYSLSNQKVLSNPAIEKQVFSYMQEGVKRAFYVIDGLKQFSDSQVGNVKYNTNVLSVLQDSLNRKLENESVTLRVIADHENYLSPICPKVLKHSLDRIIDNSIEAMNSQALKVLNVELMSLDSNRMEIRISDTGKGIKATDLDKVFDPFFTTNEPGKGLGLGLAIANKLLNDSNAKLKLVSKEGLGTTALIDLPIYKD